MVNELVEAANEGQLSRVDGRPFNAHILETGTQSYRPCASKTGLSRAISEARPNPP
jgi:hypothetical protein